MSLATLLILLLYCGAWTFLCYRRRQSMAGFLRNTISQWVCSVIGASWVMTDFPPEQKLVYMLLSAVLLGIVAGMIEAHGVRHGWFRA